MGKSKSTTSRASASSASAASAATPTRRRRSCKEEDEEEDSTRNKDSSRKGGRNNGAGVAQAATVEIRGDTGHHGGGDVSHDHHYDYDYDSIDGDDDDAGGTNTTTSSTSATTWNCHTCTLLNKNVHRQYCSFCGAVRKGDGTMSMSGNDNGEEFILDGSIHSNEVLVDNNNNILRRDSTKTAESQSSTTAEQKNRRPSGSGRHRNNKNNNKSSPSTRRVKGGGDDRNDDHKNNDDDGTGSDDLIINASDVDSIRLIDSVSKASVASSRRARRRGTVPTDDSSTMMHHSKISPRHHHQSDDDNKYRRRNTIDGGRGGEAGGGEGRSNSEQNIDQEEQQIGRNKNKIWAKEDLNDEGKQPRSESDNNDDDSDSKSSSSSSSETGSITKSGINTAKQLLIPEGRVTIVYTDVQGSTSLWETDPYSMKKATDIHDSIIRKCYSEHGGYEISTEGDSFNLAFQHPADAIGFALRAQLLLHRARWPMALLHRPEMCENEKLKFRGFRVRMGMHHGPTTLRVHKTTGRTIYQGEAVNVAKAIEKMCHGGQILTTVETWSLLSGMAEKFLGSPQVLDCGEHILFDPKKIMILTGSAGGGSSGGTSSSTKRNAKTKQRVVSKRIVQLVPNSLSYDFFAARSWQEENHPPVRVCGRVFPPLLSHGQLSTSFFNAPYVGNRVAMVFVYTHKMDKVTDRERKKNYKILAQYVRSHLMRLYPPGYECQEQKGSWMLAFDRIENGIKFGLDLKEDVIKNSKLYGNINKEITFRIGIVWGQFLSMGPHTVSGHADYFGPIVNRAARVAKHCQPGQVCVGVPMGDGDEPPDPGPSVEVDVMGVAKLKGISVVMAIFGCRKKLVSIGLG